MEHHRHTCTDTHTHTYLCSKMTYLPLAASMGSLYAHRLFADIISQTKTNTFPYCSIGVDYFRYYYCCYVVVLVVVVVAFD